jgi:NADH:ubiquinone oxidoreductase subunit 4 (subunit M)
MGRFSMMKMAAQVTVAGLAGVVALKLIFPIVGFVIAILGLLLKIGLVMAVGYFVLELFKRVRGGDCAEEEEIEVEIEEVEEVD